MSGSPVFGMLELYEQRSNFQIEQNSSRGEKMDEFFIPCTPSPSPEPLPPPLEIPSFYFDDIEANSPTKRTKNHHFEPLEQEIDIIEQTPCRSEDKCVSVSKYAYKSLGKKRTTQEADFIRSFNSMPNKTPSRTTTKDLSTPHTRGSQKTTRHMAVSTLLNAVRSPRNSTPLNFEEISATSSDEESSLAEYAKDRLLSPAKTWKKKPGIVFQSPTKLSLQMGTQVTPNNSLKRSGLYYSFL
ncbi:hypothetical protein K7432_007357 [Basidiobolus ranarum]|uniref:Uncharacterized protein n=1 Tax=Basidiobolus ranarum TaxID=34480 RepID=A0ABR2WTI7_9FUNG